MRKLIAVLLLGILILAGLFYPLPPLTDFRDTPVSQALTQRSIETPSPLDLVTLTRFDWDELFVFGPYTGRSDACRRLDLNWLRCRMILPDDGQETASYLIFRQGGQIVHAERSATWLMTIGDGLPQPLRRNNARFTYSAGASPPYYYQPR